MVSLTEMVVSRSKTEQSISIYSSKPLRDIWLVTLNSLGWVVCWKMLWVNTPSMVNVTS